MRQQYGAIQIKICLNEFCKLEICDAKNFEEYISPPSIGTFLYIKRKTAFFKCVRMLIKKCIYYRIGEVKRNKERKKITIRKINNRYYNFFFFSILNFISVSKIFLSRLYIDKKWAGFNSITQFSFWFLNKMKQRF